MTIFFVKYLKNMNRVELLLFAFLQIKKAD